MVKDDYHKTRAITDGEREIAIATEMNVYNLVFNIQEEAHRFAYMTSQSGKRKSLTRSSLENIRGIGKKKVKLLLSVLTLAEISVASTDELAAIDGISARDAENIYAYFHEDDK